MASTIKSTAAIGRTAGPLLACASIVLALAGANASAQVIYTYENTSGGAIPLAGNDYSQCRSAFSRTFIVPDSFTVSTIALGLNVSHAERGDLRVQLRAPDTSLLNPVIAQSDDTEDHYDIMISTNTEGAVDDDSNDVIAEPYFNRMVSVSGMNFYSGNAGGTWTLYLCDRDGNGTGGTFNRARLVLTTTTDAVNVCTSRVTYDWGSNGNADFTSATYGDVTMTREAAISLPAGEVVEPNQKTTTATFGGDAGYYQMRFLTSTATRESTRFYARFGFDVPVRDLQWGTLDCDTNGGSPGWEDAVRIWGTDAPNGAGVRIPYRLDLAASPSFQRAGDLVEGDTGNVADGNTYGNSTATFRGAVRSVSTEYWALDAPAVLATQRIGIMDATLCAYDFGDAPATYGTSLSNGAKHVLGNRTLWLGDLRPDGEADGAPNLVATGDDNAMIGGADDEDGYEGFGGFPSCPTDTINGTYSVPITVNNASGSTGYLVGYIDFNRDGDFADTGERSVPTNVGSPTTNGTANVTWISVGDCGGTSGTYARFRFTTVLARAESPTDGAGVSAPDGEVEDYELSAGTLPVTIARIESAVDGDRLIVRWTTASEWANAGFRVWGKDEAGAWSLLDEVAANGPDSFTPQRYETSVAGAGVAEIMLEDVSLFTERRSHPPVKVGQSAGEEPVGMKLDWGTIRSKARLSPAGSGMSARAAGVAPKLRKGPAGVREGLLQVQRPGIQRVTYEELLAAGIDLVGIAPDQIAILNGGNGVPRHVQTAGSTFGAGSFVEFVAEPQLTLASPFDAYVITVNQHRAEPAAALGTAAGELAVTEALDVYRPDTKYSFSSPNGDPWFDQGLLAWGKPAATTRTFDLPNLADGEVELDFKAWGYGGWPGSEPPDHHVIVLLNGEEIATGVFDDIAAWEPKLDVTSLVQETGNVLEVRVPGDTGYRFDYVAFEGFSVRYPRQTVAIGQRFSGAVGAEEFAVGGFDEGQTVAIWLQDGDTWRRGEQAAAQGRVQVPSGGRVWLAGQAAIVKPGLSAGVPESLATSKAEYLIVTHPAFAGALDELVALEEGRGLTTEVVTVDRIYAAYSDHAPSPDAIKSFLTASWAKDKLQYVLLVGADTTDPYNHLGAGSVSYVPTAYLPYVQYISFSPTDEALVDADGDLVGEVPIGRLPVRTPAELHQVVAKIKAWEANTAAGGRDALLTSGVSDPGTSLAEINASYSASLAGWATGQVTAEEMGAPAVRSAVLAAMNAGTPLVSYVGHSSMGQWDSSPILRWQDVAGFTNAGKPNIVAQWGCWNSYYVEPGVESLSARMLITPDAGVAAAIGATTLTTDSSHQLLGNLFYRKISEGAATLGDAFHRAKQELRTQAVAHDAILGMALLGDPAMSLPR